MLQTDIFPWNDNFEIGIARIDEQHRKLVRLINQLASHLVLQSDSLTLDIVFDELAQYAVHHFETEEGIWHQYLADDEMGVEHQRVHSSFIQAVTQLKTDDVGKSPEKVIEDILSFLTQWLAFHILDSDRRMASIVLAMQSGLSAAAAKQQTEQQMSGATQVLIETVLSMYKDNAVRTLQLMREITERKKIEAKLRLSGNVFDNTLDAICITDADTRLMDVNPAFVKSCQCSRDQILGQPLKAVRSVFMDTTQSLPIWTAVQQQGHWSGEILNRAPSGELEPNWLTLSCIRDEEGAIVNYVGVFSNVSWLIKFKNNLEHLANHDVLTGLPNRLLLSDRLEIALAQADRTGQQLAVCFLDLDGFKQVNDSLGHDAGDILLKEIAKRLTHIVRGNDSVARLGGDEFVLLLGALGTSLDCNRVLDEVLSQVSQPVQIGSQQARVTASIGVAIYPRDGADAQTLLRLADTAMYEAKSFGRSQYRYVQAV